MRCADCVSWEAGSPMGKCFRTQSDNGEPLDAASLAVARDYEDYSAILYTSPEFGCVQFKAREAAHEPVGV